MGRQPMASESGRYRIVYNGEIYNFRDLRQDLEGRGHRFRGHSDTEVALAAFEEWGVRAAVARFNGMFAFAVWDASRRRLCLGRDRLGIKPLYYGRVGQGLGFASELKAITATPGGRPSIDRDAIALFLRHNYIPAPYSIYTGIRKLLPGCLLELSDHDLASSSLPMPEPYWALQEVVEEAKLDPFSGTATEAVDLLEARLRDAIRTRLVADVPLGAFLSGGIDSSTVVALMQAEARSAVKTFSIGFREDAYDESQHARAVAEHLGTDHTELYVTPSEARSVIPLLPRLYDEPFSDSSQIPTYLVSKLARDDVTVSLSGDGGDELFAGYNRYSKFASLWKRVEWIPPRIRSVLGTLIRSVPDTAWDRARFLSPILSPYGRSGTPAAMVNRVADVLQSPRMIETYRLMVSHWKRPEDVVLGSSEPVNLQFELGAQQSFEDSTEQLAYVDTLTYLPDDILVKVDRASMSVSLEARVPLLDHRIVELAWRLPATLKRRDGRGKWILRQILERHVPRSLFERPKKGFGVPIPAWLRGPLRTWADELLAEERLRQEGYFEPRRVRDRWQEHLRGDADWGYHLWDVLMFQSWLDEHR